MDKIEEFKRIWYKGEVSKYFSWGTREQIRYEVIILLSSKESNLSISDTIYKAHLIVYERKGYQKMTKKTIREIVSKSKKR
ncbi:MAG: hypothetical protein KAI57_00760 [Candidatus Pacebacteria bacterium]|nr:hypothetical protein [Candidatus Paceibacterota bacterium]